MSKTFANDDRSFDHKEQHLDRTDTVDVPNYHGLHLTTVLVYIV